MILTVNVTSGARYVIPIGRVNEHRVTQIDFDVTGWIRMFGLGGAVLTVQRHGDTAPYLVPMTIVNGIASWVVSETDLAKRGIGTIQVTYTSNNRVKKSVLYNIHVERSMGENTTAPDAYESWLAALETMTAETSANATRAEAASTAAQESALSAGQSAESAIGSASSASASATSAQESAEWSQHYAELAEQSAANAGYVMFDVHDDDGQLYVVKTDSLNTLNFRVDENTGSLGVITNG